MRVHQLQNIQIVLNYIKFRKVKLVNIRPEDIVDGNQKLTLGLIWTIILHFQVSTNSMLLFVGAACFRPFRGPLPVQFCSFHSLVRFVRLVSSSTG